MLDFLNGKYFPPEKSARHGIENNLMKIVLMLQLLYTTIVNLKIFSRFSRNRIVVDDRPSFYSLTISSIKTIRYRALVT